MPTYESYEDNDDGVYIPVSDIDDADPDTHDHYSANKNPQNDPQSDLEQPRMS
jgi:hypothetical protein